jgi:cell division protein FtsW (lipid II flippase)
MSGAIQLRHQAGSATFSITREMSLILDVIRFSAATLVLLHHIAWRKFGTYVPGVFGQKDLNMRSWPMTVVVLVGTGLSVYLLALVTEQRKNEVRKWLGAIFRPAQPTELA